jgi:hypothetical protein
MTSRAPRSAPLVVVVSLAWALAACGASTSFERIASSPHVSHITGAEAVEVLGAAPSRPHVQIGVLKVKTSTHPPTSNGADAALTMLRQLAAENGCDAIFPGSTDEKLYATSNGTPLYRTWQSAACFMYPDP